MHIIRRKRFQCASAHFADDAAFVWVVHLFETFSLYARFVTSTGNFASDRIARLLGVEEMEERIFEDRSAVIAEVKRRCRAALEKEPSDFPAILARNIEKIARFVSLNENEARILGFTVMLHYFSEIDDACDMLEELSSADVISALSIILKIPHERTKAALSLRGILARSGLLEMDLGSNNRMRSKLDLLSSEFADRMMNHDGEEVYDLFNEMVRPVAPGTLELQDYAYMAQETQMLVRYLSSLPERERGANILLYGQPGTGKTELAKVLARELGWAIYEVSYADEDDGPMTRRERLRAYKSAQYLFSGRPVLLMFDEAEDIFETSEVALYPWRPASPVQSQKGWMNRMLENSRVPTVWISNSVSMIDPAVLRRFDIVLKMPIPPKGVRRAMVQTAFGERIDERTADSIAEHEWATPAILSRAAEVLSKLAPEKGKGGDDARRLVSGTLEAQGYRPLPKPKRGGGMAYDPAFIHADTDLAEVAEGIAAHAEARLCLYGPPGTGKSAFGRWLAEKLDKPFLLKKGSDLLSMWVGGTEANIAAAFEEAEREGAVLVFDEVDGFLQDRRGAQRSWEITQVNELLTQMESFEGVFIATTNLIDNLDPASLRRFDLKVRFDYLLSHQAEAMLKSACRNLGLPVPGHAALKRVAYLRDLTPGDFAAVMRQHRFRPLRNAGELAARLEEECMAKKERRNSVVVGFNV